MDQLLTDQSFDGAIHPMFESTGILAFCYKCMLKNSSDADSVRGVLWNLFQKTFANRNVYFAENSMYSPRCRHYTIHAEKKKEVQTC
jgi:hypothetical protein